MNKPHDFTFRHRLKMTFLILALILAMILFSIFMLLLWILVFIPMLIWKRLFIRYAFYFLKQTKIGSSSNNSVNNKQNL